MIITPFIPHLANECLENLNAKIQINKIDRISWKNWVKQMARLGTL